MFIIIIKSYVLYILYVLCFYTTGRAGLFTQASRDHRHMSKALSYDMTTATTSLCVRKFSSPLQPYGTTVVKCCLLLTVMSFHSTWLQKTAQPTVCKVQASPEGPGNIPPPPDRADYNTSIFFPRSTNVHPWASQKGCLKRPQMPANKHTSVLKGNPMPVLRWWRPSRGLASVADRQSEQNTTLRE